MYKFAFISHCLCYGIISSIYPSICDTNNDWKPDLVRYVEMPQVTLGPLVWGDGEVSLELGSETVCRRVRFEGGLNRGLLGLFASLLSSFCRGEEITQLQGLHWPNDFWTLIPAAENKTSPIHKHGDGNYDCTVKYQIDGSKTIQKRTQCIWFQSCSQSAKTFRLYFLSQYFLMAN